MAIIFAILFLIAGLLAFIAAIEYRSKVAKISKERELESRMFNDEFIKWNTDRWSLLTKINLLKIKLENTEANGNGHRFSEAELKKLRYYMHPDKHSGKTTDLWAKINGMK